MRFLTAFEKRINSFDSDSTNPQNVIQFLDQQGVVILNKAILCGDYYLDQPNGESSPDSSATALEKLELLFKKPEAKYSWVDSNRDIFRTEVSNFQRRFFSLFKELSDYVQRSSYSYLNGNEKELIDSTTFLDIRLQKEIAESFSVPETVKKRIAQESLYRINLFLAYFDENLHCDVKAIAELEKARYSMFDLRTEFQADEESLALIKILDDKIEFLIFKIKYRQNHPRWNSKPSTTAVKFPEIDSNNFYRSFYFRAEFHCDLLNHKKVSDLDEKIKSFTETNPLTILSHAVEPYHHINHELRRGKNTHKKILKTEMFLDGLSKSPDQSAHVKEWAGVPVADLVSYQSLYNLLRNTKLRLKLKQEKEWNYPEILQNIKGFLTGKEKLKQNLLRAYLDEINQFTTEKECIPEYYAYIIYLNFVDDVIEYFKENSKTIIEFKDDGESINLEGRRRKISEITNYLDKLYNEALLNLKTNFLRIRDHKSLPLYVTLEECNGSHILNNEAPLFLRSSYILPLNYNEIERDIDSRAVFFKAKKATLDVSFNTEFDKYDIQNKLTEFVKIVRENEFKVVQIVAMFVTLAAFVLLNVKIFDGKTGLESFGIIIGLAACFILFNLFFYFVTVFQIRRKITFGFVFFTILFVGSSVGLFFSSKSILKEQGKKRNQDIDSLFEGLRKMNDRLRQDTIYIIKPIKGS